MSNEFDLEMFVDQCADLIESKQDRVTEMLQEQGLTVDDEEVGEPFLRQTMRLIREVQLITDLYVTLSNAGVIKEARLPVVLPLLLSCSQLHMNMYMRLFEQILGLDEEELSDHLSEVRYCEKNNYRTDELGKAIRQIKQQLGVEN